MQKRYLITKFIGIDPGLTAGFALWDSQGDGRLLLLKSFSFFECLHQLLIFKNKLAEEEKLFACVIEDPRQNKTTFFDHRKDSNQFIHAKIAQNVGANKRDAALIAEFCQLHNIPSFLMKPSGKSLTKLSAEEFRKRFRWEGAGDQHARDAAGLVLGRVPLWITSDPDHRSGPVFLPG